MRNLAGNPGADETITLELTLAGVPLTTHNDLVPGEVPTHFTGKLGAFTFRRAWYYWVVKGPMPLDEALVLHEKFGNAVRVAGHCGCPPPEDPWIDYYNAQGFKLISRKEYERCLELVEDIPDLCKYFNRLAPSDAPAQEAAWKLVQSYHVDTQDGLNALVETIKSLKATPPFEIKD